MGSIPSTTYTRHTGTGLKVQNLGGGDKRIRSQGYPKLHRWLEEAWATRDPVPNKQSNKQSHIKTEHQAHRGLCQPEIENHRIYRNPKEASVDLGLCPCKFVMPDLRSHIWALNSHMGID